MGLTSSCLPAKSSVASGVEPPNLDQMSALSTSVRLSLLLAPEENELLEIISRYPRKAPECQSSGNRICRDAISGLATDMSDRSSFPPRKAKEMEVR